MKFSSLSLALGLLLPSSTVALNKVESFLRPGGDDTSTTISPLEQKRRNASHGSPVRNLQFWFSSGEIACRRDLEKCVARPGKVNLENWEDFLQSAIAGKEQDDQTIEKIRELLSEAVVVAADYWDSLEHLSGEDKDKLLAALPSITESIEVEKSQIEIAENGVSLDKIYDLSSSITLGFFDWFESFYNKFINVPLLGALINKVFSFFIGILELKTSVKGFIAATFMHFLSHVAGSHRRAIDGLPFMQSSVQCEAELFACEYDAFLGDTIPKLLSLGTIAVDRKTPGAAADATTTTEDAGEGEEEQGTPAAAEEEEEATPAEAEEEEDATPAEAEEEEEEATPVEAEGEEASANP